MPAILAAVIEALALIVQLLSIIKELQILANIAAKEHVPYALETIASNAANTVNHYLWGNHKLLDAINAIGTPSVGGLLAADVGDPAYAVHVLHDQEYADYTALDAKLDSILAAFGDIPSPIEPPTEGDIASAVWSFRATLEDEIAWNHLLFIENFAKNLGELASFTLQYDPFLIVEASWKYPAD
jgi:hypothetical protein